MGGAESDGSAKFGNGSENAGGGKGSTTKKTEEKINPKAVYEWAVVRWYSNEVKASDVEKSLTGKPWVKGFHTHAAEMIACVNYYGEVKDVDVVRKTVAGGNSALMSPAKFSFTFKLAKGVKEGDSKKLRDKVAAVKGILHTESLAGTSATFYVDTGKFDLKKIREAALAEGFDTTCTTHELVTVNFKYAKEGQMAADLAKALVKQKGCVVVVETNEVKGCIIVLTQKEGAAKDDVFKKIVETAGFTPGDVTRQ